MADRRFPRSRALTSLRPAIARIKLLVPPKVFRMVPRRRYIPLTALIFFVVFFFYRDYALMAGPEPATARSYHYVKTSFDWGGFKEHYPRSRKDMVALPKDPPLPLPPVQHTFDKISSRDTVAAATIEERREKVKQAFVKGWNSYKKHAWGYDELGPLSGEGKNTFGGLAATIVDALDTLWIMDLKADFHEAVAAVAAIDFMKTEDSALNVFETTIRYLGGLLSAYDLSGEPVLLRKAAELGDMLYAAFDTPNRLPGFWLNFADARAGEQRAGTADPSASPCSLGLEFTRLSQLTGDRKYFDAVDRVASLLEAHQDRSALPGMWPTLIDFRTETMRSRQFTLGALADSLYEYLPKMHALLGGRDAKYERLYRAAADTVTQHLLFRPMLPPSSVPKADILFSGTVNVETDRDGDKDIAVLDPEGQHLTCFAGGMFGLGGKLFRSDKDVNIGERLTRGCAWGYSAMPLGLLPEIFGLVPCPSIDSDCDWDEKRWKAWGGSEVALSDKADLPGGFRHVRDPRYILRPEAVESAFLLWRMTGKEEFREDAWKMFGSITNATETELAFAAVADVTVPEGSAKKLDSMESFWFSETLKYLYLAFSPTDVISLDDYVFNTEGHPLKRP